MHSDKSERDQYFELLRLLAIFGVIAFHALVPAAEFAYSGLIVFVILSLYFASKRPWDNRRSVYDLLFIFLAPWLFWSVVFAAKNFVIGKPVFSRADIVGLVLIGPSIHLWFLPAMFFAHVFFDVLKRYLSRATTFWFCFIITVVLLLSFPAWHAFIVDGADPFKQWLHATPGVFIGISLGLLPQNTNTKTIYFVILFSALIFLAFLDLPGVSTPYFYATVLVVCFSLMKSFFGGNKFNIQKLSSCTMGIYLLHPLVLGICRRVIGEGSYITAAITFIISFGIVFTMRSKIRHSQIVLG